MTPAKTSSERWLSILLRIGGVVMLTAFGAVFMPTDWMAAAHQQLGLGEFPTSPLVDYLTRSASALYTIYGGLYLVVASDVRRFARVIVYLATVNIVFGLLMVAIDLHAGLPLYWILGEGPPVVAFGVILLLLLKSVPPQPTNL